MMVAFFNSPPNSQLVTAFCSLPSTDSLHGGSTETLLFDNPAYLYTVTRPHPRDGRDYFLHLVLLQGATLLTHYLYFCFNHMLLMLFFCQ